jgi:hypothetical protein
VRCPRLRVHRHSKECEAEAPFAKEEATCHHPATSIVDSGLPDFPLDVVPELLREFLNNDEIIFWGAVIQRLVDMLKYYEITFLGRATSSGRSPTKLTTILQVSMM